MLTLVDVWEGALDIEETTLQDGGVVGIIIRLNDMNGGHHLDENFATQWAQAVKFLRAPYFVYNPWVNAETNFSWLYDHVPEGVTRVFMDVEVRKPGYSQDIYADEYQKFYDLAARYYKVATYTGGWFLSVLSHWPDGDYWWGRYPYYLCPRGDKVFWPWEEFNRRACTYGYKPDPENLCPGRPVLWQCSGDKVILPGTANRPIDLNLWNGSLAALEAWWGNSLPTPPMSRLDILWREAEIRGWNLNQ